MLYEGAQSKLIAPERKNRADEFIENYLTNEKNNSIYLNIFFITNI